MKTVLPLLACAAVATPLHAQQPSAQDQRPPYLPIRADEDWSELANPARRKQPIDDLKYIVIGNDLVLTLGGDMRLHGEYYDNEQGGRFPGADTSLHRRLKAHASLKSGDRLRLFVELQDAGYSSRRFPHAPVERDDLDVFQAFAEIGLGPTATTGPTSFLRVGRQELNLGSGKLITIREGPNARESFDGVRAHARLRGDIGVDAGAFRFVETRPGAFDNGWAPEWLWYAFGSQPLGVGGLSAELYFVGHRRRESVALSGPLRDELRHSFGGRLWREQGRTTGELELGLQRGRAFGPAGRVPVRAWYVAASIRHALDGRPGSPALGIDLGVTSGDEAPGSGAIKTFHPPTHPGRYFGDAPEFGPGNIGGARFYAALSVSRDIVVTPRVQGFWRVEREDGLYSPPGFPIILPQPSSGNFVGWEAASEVALPLTPQLTVTGSLARFTPGTFFDALPARRPTTYGEIAFRAQF